MNIRKFMLRSAVAFSAFALGYAAFAEYRFVRSFLESGRLEQTVVPRAEMDAISLTNAELYTPPMEEVQTEVVSSGQTTENTYDFDASGTYSLADFEKPAKGFEDFEYLEIVAMIYETDTTPATPIPPRGGIRAKRMYKFKNVAISPTDIAFETETVRGINYKFVGSFPRGPFGESCAVTAADITGQLTKLKNGKRVATKKAEFLLDCGC